MSEARMKKGVKMQKPAKRVAPNVHTGQLKYHSDMMKHHKEMMSHHKEKMSHHKGRK